MLVTSQPVLPDLPHPNQAAVPAHRERVRSDHRLTKAHQNRIKDQKRKVAGLCSYGTCPENVEPGHTHCQNHLQAMAEYAIERRNERIAQGLCIYCGVRPPFWGRRCLICRQSFAKDSLPRGAKRALRLYRKAEERGRLELIRKEAQAEARNLLGSGKVSGKPAQALRLYMGLDDGRWRNYRTVGSLLKVSVERVRQLLLPSKAALSEALSGRVPWRPLEELNSNGKHETRVFPKTTCKHRERLAVRLGDDGSYPYEECGISSVLLYGLRLGRCQVCKREAVSIPRVGELNQLLARAVLLKPTSLSGRELRFLRKVAGFSRQALAKRLDVAFQTIVTWEESEALRGPNDLAVRAVMAALIASDKDFPRLLKMLRSIRTASEPLRLRAEWINDEGNWAVSRC